MHFHLPKPLHGWREFVGEVGIIVIGVLLALGAENLVERWHWREQADISKDAFKGELGTAAGVAYERLVIQPCLQGRIRELSQLLADGTGAWKASPMAGTNKLYLNVMPVVYRAPSRLLPMDGWKNALSNETLNHLPAEQVRDLSALYNQIGDYDTLQKDEDKAAARLVPLAFNRVLDDRSRADLQASLAEVDRINSLMALEASQIMEAVRALHLKYPASEVQGMARAVVKEQRAFRGSCVLSLPVDFG